MRLVVAIFLFGLGLEARCPLRGEMRDVLRDLARRDTKHWGQDTLFVCERTVRPWLRELVRDPEVGGQASHELALTGVPEDVSWLVGQAPWGLPKRANYFLVSALLEPQSGADWAYLERQAANEEEDLWADRGAIETLEWIGTEQAAGILERARERNPFRAIPITRALGRMEQGTAGKGRPPKEGADVEELARAIARYRDQQTWQGNGPVRWNVGRDKALVDLKYVIGTEGYLYTATFHRVRGKWRLRGFRETLHMYVAPGLMKAKPERPLLDPPQGIDSPSTTLKLPPGVPALGKVP